MSFLILILLLCHPYVLSLQRGMLNELYTLGIIVILSFPLNRAVFLAPGGCQRAASTPRAPI
jgi:hypothetical protein